ncbi:MAG: AraC family transcriptional regulator [Anaerolineaceae bacterium]|nr:MAG: AraC family transcriptional regulator [Anaerolineaceae bacterium]
MKVSIICPWELGLQVTKKGIYFMDKNYYVETRDMYGQTPHQFSTHIQEALGPQIMVHAHIHNYIEIIYALSGKYRILLDNKEYSFSEGDMVLINSNEIHSIFSLSTGSNQYVVIKFDPEIFYTTAQSLFEMKYIMPFILNESTHQKVFPKEAIVDTVIPGLISNISNEFLNKCYGYELAVRANIYNLFLFILRSWNEQNANLDINMHLNKDMVIKFQTVFDYIEDNYQDDITALEMAQLCNLSYSYFSRLFTRIMKINFRAYLNYVRITKSERLLTSTDLNITEVALQVGFSTSSYFIQQFKFYKDITPKQYQIKYKV